MTYKVKVSKPAEKDISEAVEFITRDSRSAASKWYDGLWKLIFSLAENPYRFSVIPEVEELGYPFRSAIYHSHRVVFRVEDSSQTVYIVRVYHGARHPLSIDDISASAEDY